MVKYHDALLSALSVSAALLLSAAPLWSQTASPVHGTQSESMRSSQGGMAQADVKSVQEALKEKGHDPGPADGIMGPKTQAAIKEFQQAQGLKATGTLDDQTRQALGLNAGSSNSGQKNGAVSGQESIPENQPAPQDQTSPGTETSPSPSQPQGQ